MHKNFAKSRFLGFRTECLTQCHSTNDEMMKRVRAGEAMEGDVIRTEYQSGGKGQRGNVWISEAGRNLLFSLNLEPHFLNLSKLFLINVVVSNALKELLRKLRPEDLVEIKWPNDIYLNDRKIAGILVETVLGGKMIENAIVGIGLNANQSHFSLDGATSLVMEGHPRLNLDELLENMLVQIEEQYLLLKAGKEGYLLQQYHQSMRWRGERHVFMIDSGYLTGEIIGVDERGRLVVSDGMALRTFNVKEIEFVE